jgi:hypothetical protein
VKKDVVFLFYTTVGCYCGDCCCSYFSGLGNSFGFSSAIEEGSIKYFIDGDSSLSGIPYLTSVPLGTYGFATIC